MPLVTPNNNYLIGIHKQTNESTVGTVADYSVPVYSATLGPTYEDRRVEVTDAQAIQADAYKGLTSWSADVEVPAFGRSLGVFLQTLWPTDTPTGTDPKTHTFSGLGAVQPWVAMYSEWPGAGAFEQTFGAGVATGITFSATAEGGPLRIGYTAIGKTPSVANYTVTTADTLADGYFTLQATGANVEADYDTPNVNPTTAITNVTSVELSVTRDATPVQTVDGVSVNYLSTGRVVPAGTMEVVYDSWDMYRASYFGAVAGSAVSPTIVKGALDLNFKHSTDAAVTFELYVPSVQFKVDPPTPSPSGDALSQSVTLNVMKPTTGDHVQPILVNHVTTTY